MCEEELRGLHGLVKVMVLPRTHAFGSARDFAQIWQQRGFFIYSFIHIVGKPLINWPKCCLMPSGHRSTWWCWSWNIHCVLWKCENKKMFLRHPVVDASFYHCLPGRTHSLKQGCPNHFHCGPKQVILKDLRANTWPADGGYAHTCDCLLYVYLLLFTHIFMPWHPNTYICR